MNGWRENYCAAVKVTCGLHLPQAPDETGCSYFDWCLLDVLTNQVVPQLCWAFKAVRVKKTWITRSFMWSETDTCFITIWWRDIGGLQFLLGTDATLVSLFSNEKTFSSGKEELSLAYWLWPPPILGGLTVSYVYSYSGSWWGRSVIFMDFHVYITFSWDIVLCDLYLSCTTLLRCVYFYSEYKPRTCKCNYFNVFIQVLKTNFKGSLMFSTTLSFQHTGSIGQGSVNTEGLLELLGDKACQSDNKPINQHYSRSYRL